MRVLLERGPCVEVQHVPRHPEVDQESPTRFEPDNQILAATIDCHDALAFQLGRDLNGVEWARQPWVRDLDSLEAAPHEPGLEPATDGFDLWKLRHRTRVVRGLGPDAPGSDVATKA